MALNSVAFKAAPPTNPPSTSGWEKISIALAAFTLPPYNIEIWSATDKPYFAAKTDLMNAWISWACALDAVFPVPIAQIGS